MSREKRAARDLRRRKILAWMVAGFFLVFPIAAIGTASASSLTLPYGFKTPDGSFVVPYFEGFLSESSITPGGLMFGDAVDIEFINEAGNRTIPVSVYENGTSIGQPSLWANFTYAVPGNAISVLPTFNLPSTRYTLPTRLCVDNGCVLFLHQTPVTIIPYGVLTFGGLDLIAFAVTLETLLIITPLTFWARTLARRALWFPKINWAIILPHFAFGFMLLIANDFPALDMAFGGLEFVVFPIVIGLLWFFFVIHMFNVATPVMVDQLAPGSDDRTRFTTWWLMLGVLPDGRWIIVGTRWRDAFYRLRGKAPVVWDPTKGKEANPPPAIVPIVNRRIAEPDAIWNAQRHHWETFRAGATRGSPFESFPATNVRIRGVDATPRRELPLFRLHVDHDEWLSVKLPYLWWWREEKIPAEYNPDGTIRKRARIKQRLTWPHIVVPAPITSLSPWQFEDPLAASLGYISQERAYRLNGELRRQLHKLLTGVYVLADEQTKQSLREVFELLERERFPIKLEEAQEGAAGGGAERTRSRAEEPPEPTGRSLGRGSAT